MDTGLHDHDVFTVGTDVTWLDPEEETWHLDKIRRFSDSGGRTVLLSHHQLFTAFDPIGRYADRSPAQRAATAPVLAGRVTGGCCYLGAFAGRVGAREPRVAA